MPLKSDLLSSANKNNDLALKGPITVDGLTLDESSKGNFERGFDTGVGQLKRGVLGAGKLAAAAVGADSLEERLGRAVQDEEHRQASMARPQGMDVTEIDWSDYGDVSNWVAGTLGSAAPSLIAGAGAAGAAIATGGGAIPVMAAMGAASAIPAAGETYLDIEQETGVKAPGTAALTGLATGAFDVLGARGVAKHALPNDVIEKLIRSGISEADLAKIGIKKATDGAVRRVVKGAATEGGTEAAQGVIGDLGRSAYIEGVDPFDFNARLNDAAAGALVGGGIPASISAGNKVAEQVKSKADQVSERREANREQQQAFRDAGIPEGTIINEKGTASFEQGPLKGKVDLTQQAGQEGDAGVAWTRGLQAVEAMVSRGYFSDEKDAGIRKAIKQSREYLENPDKPIPDEVLASIKTAFEDERVKQVYETAEQFDSALRRGDYGVNEFLDEYVDSMKGFTDNAVSPDDLNVMQQGLTEQDGDTQPGDRYFFPSRNGSPKASVAAVIEAANLAGVSLDGQRDSVQAMIDRFNQNSKKEKYEKATYTQALQDEWQFTADKTNESGFNSFEQFAKVKAKELYDQILETRSSDASFSVSYLYDPNDPVGFLDRFEVIRRVGQKPTENVGDLSLDDLKIGIVRKDDTGNFNNEETADSILVRNERGSIRPNPQAGILIGKANGKRVGINIHNAALKHLQRRDENTQVDDGTNEDRISMAVAGAITDLLTSPYTNIEIDLNAIDPNTVMFNYGVGNAVVWGDISNKVLSEKSTLQRGKELAARAVELEQQGKQNSPEYDQNKRERDQLRTRLFRAMRKLKTTVPKKKGNDDFISDDPQFIDETDVSGGQETPQKKKPRSASKAERQGFEDEPDRFEKHESDMDDKQNPKGGDDDGAPGKHYRIKQSPAVIAARHVAETFLKNKANIDKAVIKRVTDYSKEVTKKINDEADKLTDSGVAAATLEAFIKVAKEDTELRKHYDNTILLAENAIKAATGLKFKFPNYDQNLTMLRRAYERGDVSDSQLDGIVTGSHQGFSSKTSATQHPDTDMIPVFINPLVHPAESIGAAIHEASHIIAFRADDMNRLANFAGVDSANPFIKNMIKTMTEVDKEYKQYVLNASDLSAAKVITERRGRFGLLNTLSKNQNDNVPFIKLKNSSYLLSRDEWVADRISAMILHNAKVSPVMKAYFNALKESYWQFYFMPKKPSNTQMAEIFNAWVPLAAAQRKNVDAWKKGTMDLKWMNDDRADLGPDVESAVESMTDEFIQEVDKIVKKTLGVSVQKFASKWTGYDHLDGPERSKFIIKKLMEAAAVDKNATMSNVHNEIMRQMITDMLTQEEFDLLHRVASSQFVKKQMVDRLQNSELAMSAMDDAAEGAEATVAYMYQLYMSDPSFRLGAPPRSLFEKLRSTFSDILGEVEKDVGAGRLLTMINEGVRAGIIEGSPDFQIMEDRVYGPSAKYRNSKLQRAINSLSKNSILASSQERMQMLDNPVLRSVSDLFHRRLDNQGSSQTYFEEVQERTGAFMVQANEIIGDLSDEQMASVHNVMNTYTEVIKDPASRNSPEVKTAEKMFLLFDDMRSYLKGAGVDIGARGEKVKIGDREVHAYVPWQFDTNKLIQRSAEAREVLLSPEYKMRLKELGKIYADDGKPMAAEDVVDKIISDIIFAANGLEDGVIEDSATGFAPGMDSFMKRSLWWLLQDSDTRNPISKENKQFWHEVMEDGLYNIVENYVGQGVKRAAFTKRFGVKASELDRMFKRARATGATQEELHYTTHYIQSMLGSYGRNTNIKINTAINWAAKKLGAKDKVVPEDPAELINPKFAKFQQVAMVYENLRLLDFAVFTSLVDPAGIAVRSGSLTNAVRSFRDGVSWAISKQVTGNKAYVESLSEQLGIAEQALSNAAMQQQYGGTWMNGKTQQVNDALFKYTGLSAWTRLTRVMATSSAMQFMKFHSKNPTPDSAAWLTELGLYEGDLTDADFNEQGHIVVLPEAVRKDLASSKKRNENNKLVNKTKEEAAADRKQLARDNRIRNAIVRYTNEAILRPNAAQRPVWASDPHFAIVFHLKQFMWSMATTTIAHAANRAKAGHYAPLLLMGTLYPLMMGAIDAVRDYLRFGEDGAPWLEDASTLDYINRSVERSGLYGRQQIWTDAAGDFARGDPVFKSFSGPALGHMMELLSVPLREDRTLEGFIDRATPLQNTTSMLETHAGF